MIEQLIDMAVARAWVGWLALVAFWLLGMGVILCLVAMLRRDARGQAADDLEQIKAITRPATLERSTADVIPWTRRVTPRLPERRQ